MDKKGLIVLLIVGVSMFCGFLFGGIHVNQGIYKDVKERDAIMRINDRLSCTMEY